MAEIVQYAPSARRVARIGLMLRPRNMKPKERPDG